MHDTSCRQNNVWILLCLTNTVELKEIGNKTTIKQLLIHYLQMGWGEENAILSHIS
jgi:hypothetical protein